MPWDPQVHDHECNIQDLEPPIDSTLLDPTYHSDTINDFGEMTFYNVNYQRVQPKQLDFTRLLPNFGYVPVDRIKHTLKNTTQFDRLDTRLPLRKHYKTRFPDTNVSRLNKTVATDTFFSDIPAIDDGIIGHGGSTMLQLYCGC
jgi:hypothetical protein